MDIVDQLRELAQRIEESKLQKEAELNRLYDRLAYQEQNRRESYDRVSWDNADTEAMNELDSAERNEATLKAKIHEMKTAGEQELRVLHQELMTKREQAEKELRDQFNAKRKELDRLRTELIPQVQKCLDDLKERQHRLDSETLVLTSKLTELRRFDFETVDLELSF